MIDSGYLCKCGHLLYVDLKSKDEHCDNPNCHHFFKDKINEEPTQVIKDLEIITNKLKLELRAFNKEFILKNLYELRETLIEGILLGKGMDMDYFYSINELLHYTYNLNFDGRSKSINKLTECIEKYHKHIIQLNFLDKILTRKYISSGDGVYILKYNEVLANLLDNYGLTNSKRYKEGKAFKYENIDMSKDYDAEYKYGDDLIIYYKRFWRLMITLHYLFSFVYRQRKFYSYISTKNDIALLLSLFYSIDKRFYSSDITHFKKHLTKNTNDKSKHRDFIEHYATDDNIAPIFLVHNSKVVCGRHTSLLFVLYLMGQNSNIIEGEKDVISTVFEEKIREKLRELGLHVPLDRPLRLDNSETDFDVIGLNKEKKIVYLIEVKYKDLRPSLFNPKLLLKNEMEQKNGIVALAKKQKDAINYFKDNLEEINKRVEVDLNDYAIKGYVVAKYKPLIKSYNDIKTISFDEIESSI